MQKKSVSLVLAAALLAASASVINYSSRASSTGPLASGIDYKNHIEGLTAVAPGAGYCDTALGSLSGITNQGVCGGSNNNDPVISTLC